MLERFMNQIYKITNKVNGKVYIGLTTVGIKKRMSCYKSASKNPKKSEHHIVEVIKKYGFDKFEFEVLEEVNSKEELRELEIAYIKQFGSFSFKDGYNRDPGGFIRSKESLKKTSLKLKNRVLTKDHKEKISKGLMGHVVSKETKLRLSISHLGQKSWNKGTKGIVKPNSGSFGYRPKVLST